MDPSYHRGRQSFDTGRGVSFDRLDSQAEWRQQSTVPAITPHVWTPQLGEARRLQQQQHYRQPSGFTDYPSEPPSPAQSNMSNSWAAQTVPPKYAYYLDRGNGYVTRLIPADALPNLNEIPPQELRGLGMEILQPLRGSPPNGAPNMDQKVTVQNGGRTLKKEKTFCDKWVHEGICAFQQQGCRFKHEMPSDKATQISLGLFQGYPAWWKKHQADLQRQRVIAEHQQPFSIPTAPRMLMPPGGNDDLADSQPDTPTTVRSRAWRRPPGLATPGQMGRRNSRWSLESACYPHPPGVIEPPNQRR